MYKQFSSHKGTTVFVIFFLAFIFFAFAKKEHNYYDAEEKLFVNPKDSSEKIKDSDGNSYKTVKIGKQIWMAENLKTTTYQNGDKIIYIEMNKMWKNFDVGAYSYYDNDKSNIAKYGMIYNIEAISDDRGICPKGYRVPTNADWDTLVVFLGGEKKAGGKLKSKKYWNHPNTAGKDLFGFGALPGGTRGKDGTYNFVQFNGYYWTHLENDSASSCVRYFDFSYADIFKGYDKTDGFSCKCMRDK